MSEKLNWEDVTDSDVQWEDVDAGGAEKRTAESLLHNGAVKNLPVDSRKVATDVLGNQGLEREDARAYYSTKDGRDYDDIALDERIKIDYGTDATPQVANQLNKKPRNQVNSYIESSQKFWHMNSRFAPKSSDTDYKFGAAGEDHRKLFMGGMRKVPSSAVSGIMGLDLWVRDKYKKHLWKFMSPEQQIAYDEKTKFITEWRGAVKDIEKEDYDLWTDSVPDSVKGSFGGKVSGNLGQMPLIAMYMNPIGAGVATVGNYGRMFDEGYESSIAAGKSEDQALNIGASTMAINGTIESVMDQFTAGLGSKALKVTGKPARALLKRVGLLAAKGQAVAGSEALTEIIQSSVTQKLATGKIDPAQAFEEGVMGYVTSVFTGTGSTIANVASNSKQTKALEDLGLNKEQAEEYKVKLSEAYKANDEVVIEEVQREVSEAARQNIGETVLSAMNPVADIGETISAKGYTLGEANSIRNTMSDSEIVKMIDGDANITDKQAATDAFKTPTESTVQNLNDSIFGEAQSAFEGMLGDVGVKKDEDADKQEQQVDEIVEQKDADEEGVPSIVGISRAQNNQWREMLGQGGLSAPERITQMETLEEAYVGDLQKNTAAYIDRADKGSPLSHLEVGALLIRKAEITNDISELADNLEEATAAGDADAVAEWSDMLNERVQEGVRITEAARKGATENARALAAMAMTMDRNSFDLVNVAALATATKGEPLTTEEQEQNRNDIKELDEINAEIDSKSKQIDLQVEEKYGTGTEGSESDAIKILRTRKAELKREARIRKDRELLIDEVEKLHRRIIKKKATGKGVSNSDMQTIKARQDKIINIINELNRGREEMQKVSIAQQEDSEGYLSMLNNLRVELKAARTERRLTTDIEQMELDIKNENFAPYMRDATATEQESEELMKLRAKRLRKQREILSRIEDMRTKTMSEKLWDIYDIPRSMRLTADVGHLLRQGGITMSNPRMWLEGRGQGFYRQSFRAFTKEGASEAAQAIEDNPLYESAKLAGLRLIEEGQKLDSREEILLKKTSGFGRMQIEGVNTLRMATFESYMQNNPDATLSEMKEVAQAVNILTGYGKARGGDGSVDRALNKILISPRFTYSRFQAPIVLAMKGPDGRRLWQNKKLRNRVIEDTAWTMGIRMAIMYLASLALPEAEIGDDPEKWTYGRLIVDVGSGNKRVYDPWMGVHSATRVLYPLLKGETGIGETIGKLIENRMHPAITGVEEIVKGETFYGEEQNRIEGLLKMMIPISVEGAVESIKADTGVIDLFTSLAADIVGINSALVDEDSLNDKKKTKRKKF